jgi:hypothetical protein
MWWQQTPWKLPPAYTDHPEQAFGETGLAYWMTVIGKSAAIPLQADFENQIVLPHFRGRRSRLLGVERLWIAAEAISFQSSNAWDAYAASVFGMRVVWCNRYGQQAERSPGRPDHEVASLAQLPALIGA